MRIFLDHVPFDERKKTFLINALLKQSELYKGFETCYSSPLYRIRLRVPEKAKVKPEKKNVEAGYIAINATYNAFRSPR